MSQNSLERVTGFNIAMLDNSDYFTSFVLEAQNCGQTDAEFTEKIKVSCMELLADKCEDFTGGLSSSLRAETADSIMQSVFFALDLYAKSISNTNEMLDNLKRFPVRAMYLHGRELIEKKKRMAKMLFVQTYKNAVVTENLCYNDTLIKGGLYSFFKKYNADYAAKEVPCIIDYPLAHSVGDLFGVEYIISYLENLYMENTFCAYFDYENIQRVLNGVCDNPKEAVVNIYETVLTQCIGCVLANKNPFLLELTKEDIDNLYEKLVLISKDDRIDAVLLAYKALMKGMGIKKQKMLDYNQKTVKKILQRLFYNIKTNSLDKLFVVPKDTEFKADFEYGQEEEFED